MTGTRAKNTMHSSGSTTVISKMIMEERVMVLMVQDKKGANFAAQNVANPTGSRLNKDAAGKMSICVQNIT
jgi:hypothetical protein